MQLITAIKMKEYGFLILTINGQTVMVDVTALPINSVSKALLTLYVTGSMGGTKSG